MAKYVLLAFDSDAEADEFVAAVSRFDIKQQNTEGFIDTVKATVRGIWKKPTKFCECTSGNIKQRGWTRGKKFGWWVCDKCYKPSPAWARGDLWYNSLGVNLLPVSFEAPEYRGPRPLNLKELKDGT